MNPHYDIVIAGAGLAGASAGLFLAREHRVLIVDSGGLAAGASGAGAGLVNPLLGRRARPAWKLEEALEAFEELVEECRSRDLYDDRGVVRPAAGEVQADRYVVVADARPDLALWLSPERAAEEFPSIRSPFGVLRVVRGGAIDIRRLVERMVDRATSLGAVLRTETRLIEWRKSPLGVVVELLSGAERWSVSTKRLIVAVGDGFRHLPETMGLGLHRVKGQTIRIKRPQDVHGPCAIPPVSGDGYIVPEIATWVLGSTYEHDFGSTAPTAEADIVILSKTSKMIAEISGSEVIERRAGVRVTVPRHRLPMVGPLGNDRVWFVGGLGSKGLLMAPLIARSLEEWMLAPGLVPQELSLAIRR